MAEPTEAWLVSRLGQGRGAQGWSGRHPGAGVFQGKMGACMLPARRAQAARMPGCFARARWEWADGQHGPGLLGVSVCRTRGISGFAAHACHSFPSWQTEDCG